MGFRPKAEKIIVTSPILIAEVVVDVPKETSDRSPGAQDVFELLNVYLCELTFFVDFLYSFCRSS
jgi:hypothetical protein